MATHPTDEHDVEWKLVQELTNPWVVISDVTVEEEEEPDDSD